MKPRITVLLPVFNGQAFVGAAVVSVLKQTVTDFELLVIDDGSTDGTMDILRSFRDPRLILRQNGMNLGLARTLNLGLELARGDYIARMDADDWCYPARLEVQAQFMDEHREVGICGTWVRSQDSGGSVAIKYPVDPDVIRASMPFYCPLAHPSVMLRKDLVDLHALRYDETFETAQDYDLWARASERFQLSNVPRVLVGLRAHAASVTSARAAQQREASNIVRARQLTALGIVVTDRELALHESIGTGACLPPGQSLEQACSWLEKLLVQNRRSPRYPTETFEAVSAERWASLCLANAQLGVRVWVEWRRSPLHRSRLSARFIGLKILAKAIVPHFLWQLIREGKRRSAARLRPVRRSPKKTTDTTS